MPTKQFLHNGWIGLWRSREEWASSLELGFHQPFAHMLVGFDPAMLNLPTLDWRSLSADLARFERATQPNENNMRNRQLYLDILNLMRSGSVDTLRYKIAERIDLDGYCRNIPMHAPGTVPVWFGARLMPMLMAVECVRLARGKEDVDEEVARLLLMSTDLRRSLRSLQG